VEIATTSQTTQGTKDHLGKEARVKILDIVKGATRDRIADNLDREFSAEPLHVVFSTKYSCNATTSILRQGLD
jgi:hypothetical protein